MVEVVIDDSLKKQVYKKFKEESVQIFKAMMRLEEESHKGKLLATVSNIHIKELKCKSFRFYFLTDGHVLKFGNEEEITNLLIKFVRMSDKKNQQKVINEIKEVLDNLSFENL